MPDLSEKELKWGYWYFLHRDMLRRIGYTVGFTVAAVMWVYAGWQFIDWYSSRKAEEESLKLLVSSSVNVEEYRKNNTPVPPEVGVVTAVPAGEGVYDLVAQVKNPNLKWGIKKLSYTFVVEGKDITGSSFLLPLDDKYVVNLGVSLDSQPRQMSLTITNIDWQRIHDVTTFVAPSFDVTEEHFDSVPAATGSSAGRLKFTLTNTSPSNFYEVGVTVVLTTGSSIQAVGRQTITNVRSQAARTVEFYWPHNLPMADHLVVKPEVNVFDPGVVQPL